MYAHTEGVHGNDWFDPVNVDLATGARIVLADLASHLGDGSPVGR